MRLKDTRAQKEGLLQLAPKQFPFCPIGSDAIGMIVQGHIRMAGPPINLPGPSTEGEPGGKPEPGEGRKILRFAGEVIIKSPAFEFVIEVVTVKKFSTAADVVAVSLENSGSKTEWFSIGLWMNELLLM